MENRPFRVLIWGGGSYFRKMLPFLQERERTGEIVITGVIARQRPDGGTISGYPYIAPESVPSQEYDILQILTLDSRREIREEYLRMPGSDPSKVIAQIYPEIGIRQYQRLAAARPTIFSMLCWGGFVYYHLGMECVSPFKNMWLTDYEFLRFLHDPRGYMAMDPVPSHMQPRINELDKEVYPVLRLGDIMLHCNHSDSMEQAIADWKRRREKINWDFTVAVMQTDNRSREKEFNRLDTVHRKLCIVPYQTSEPFSSRDPALDETKKIFLQIDGLNGSAFPFRNRFDMYSLFFGELKDNACYCPPVKR